MITLAQARANLGKPVRYQNRGVPAERGIIREVGHVYVFVRYDGEQVGKATNPDHLTLVED